MVTSKFSSLTEIAIKITIVWYILVCSINYLYNQRPLWNDEQCVFLSVESFSIKEMFGKDLLSLQVFPRVYHFFIQQFSKLFDFHVLALRFPSFICMMLAFWLWLKIAKEEFKNRWEYFIFILSWAASMMMIYYSSELKQYSMDVLVGAIYILSFKKQMENPSRLILLFLLILCLFSYTGFLFACILSYNLLVLTLYNKKNFLNFIVFNISLFLITIVSYYIDMRFRNVEGVTSGYHDYFIYYSSFEEFLKTFGEGFKDLFTNWFVTQPKIVLRVGMVFFILGMLSMFSDFFGAFKKEKFFVKTLSMLGFVLFLELFILASFKKYPFTVPRTVLFYAPICFCLIIKGIIMTSIIHKNLPGILRSLYIIYLLILAISIPKIIFIGGRLFQPIF